MKAQMLQERSAGILLHLSSLPNTYFVGDLGSAAYDFVDSLSRSGLKWWQLLPLNPIGGGNSPYSSVSAFASEPLYVDLEGLVDWGLLERQDLKGRGAKSRQHAVADYEKARRIREPLWRKAFARWQASRSLREDHQFDSFCEAESYWLYDYCLFMVIAEKLETADWLQWSVQLRDRDPDALALARQEWAQDLEYFAFLQYLFHKQWKQLHKHCAKRQVRLMGDMPIFVALQSADVWAHRSIFQLAKSGQPKVVAGVPPDLFSEEGQLWGNALYDWKALEATEFSWWKGRFQRQLALFDAVRVDHFIGFYRNWAIPYQAKSAKEGKWQRARGEAFFQSMQGFDDALSRLVAEDLGAMIPAVTELRKKFSFPGMKVLQFGFGGNGGSEYLPHCYERNFVVYPGTHDNNTVIGWFSGLDRTTKKEVLDYLGTSADQVNWGMVRAALSSVANVAILPMQDVLGLGKEARMNFPGTAQGNWQWRFEKFPRSLEKQLHRLCKLYGR